MMSEAAVGDDKPGFWTKILLIFPMKWGVGTCSLWLLEQMGFFSTFELDQLGITHLTWAQRAGISLIITP